MDLPAEIFCSDAEATEAAGRDFAALLRPGDIVKITGSLGAGKTTWVRGVVAGLGANPDLVHSPTFALVHEYNGPTNSINHCDFYRLPTGSELEDFGGLEFFATESIFLIEWPERTVLWKYITPDRLFHVDLRHDASGRTVRLSPRGNILD